MIKPIREPASKIIEAVSQIREPASQMSKAMTTSIKESASQMTISTCEQDTVKFKQPLLAKEVFSPQITKFRRERIVPLYKDETWSADLIDKSSLSKYNNNYKFILTVIDIFTKYAWAIPLKNKSGLSITKGFKTILSEGPKGGSESRKPEKLWVDRGSEFYNKTFKSLIQEYVTKLYSIYSDLKAVFIERFNRTLLHIINKPMFLNGDGNWVNILNDAVVTYNNNIHSTINNSN